MPGVFARIARRLRGLEQPAPRRLVAMYLSRRWGASVSPSADVRWPSRLRLGAGAVIGRCQIVCTAEVTLGSGVEIRDGAILDAQGGPISIGDRSVVNPYCVLYGAGGLAIGRDVGIATHTVIIPANHRYETKDTPILSQPVSMKGVTIEDDVWVASGCIVLDGVTIRSRSIVAAGSVVASDVGPAEIVIGSRRLMRHPLEPTGAQ